MFFGGADGLRSEHHNGREEVHDNNECTQREESMTTIKAIRLASLVSEYRILLFVICGGVRGVKSEGYCCCGVKPDC
jgi:hypothetical protein